MTEAFGLSDKEIDIVRSICAGRGVLGAATCLHLSPHTVSDRLKLIRQKMGVHCMAAMALKAERAGLLEGVNP